MKRILLKRILLVLITFSFSQFVKGQTTVNYVMQTGSFSTFFGDGGGFFNSGVATMGMYANQNGTAKQGAAWRTFKTVGDNTGSNRALQVGDVFVITVSCTRAFGQIGFSLNAAGSQGSNYSNRVSGSRLYVNSDNYGAWYVNRSGGATVLGAGYNPILSTYKDYRFTVRITSSTTADVFLTVDGIDFRAFNLTMNGSASIDAFSVYGSDMWDGDSNDDAFWKQTATVTNTSTVQLGYFLTSGTYTPGVISNGLDAGSTSTVSVNNVLVGGDVGSFVILNQTNTYTGTTTVNNNARLELQNAQALGSTSGLTVQNNGALSLYSPSGISYNTYSTTLNGAGVSGANGALRSTGGNNTWSGAITLNSSSRINADTSGTAGSLTLLGNIGLGANNLTVGTFGANVTISGAINGSGGITKDGTGILNLTNTNTYTGATNVSAGTLLVTKSGYTATITTSGISVAFSSAPTRGIFQILPGALSSTSTLLGTTGLGAGQVASFNGATGVLTVNDTPTVSLVSNDSDNIFCIGTSVTFTATAANIGGGTVAYDFKVNGGSVQNSGSNVYTTSGLTGTQTVTVDITITGGTFLSSNTASNSIANIVNSLPTAPVSGSTSFCAGGNTLLNSNATAGSGTISSYQWKVGGVDVASGGTSVTYTASAAGSYTVTITNTNGCSFTSAPYVVSVNALPTASVSGNTSFCAGGSTSLNSNATAGSGTISAYQWKVGGVNVASGGTSATYAATAAGSYTVTLTNSNGCSFTSAPYAVTVNPLPTTPTITAGGSTTFCSGGSVELTASSGNSYLWSTGATTPSITATTAGDYTVQVTNSFGCQSLSSVATTVTLTAQPTWYLDADGDGYSSSAAASVTACTRPVGGYKLASELHGGGVGSIGTDCLDSNQYANPGQAEICYDGIDNNCDGSLVNGCPNITTTFWTSVCGQTLPALNTSIRPYYSFVGSLPSGVSVTGYRFMITNLTSSQTRVVETANSLFRITDTNIASYGTNYSIKVSIKLNEEWQDYNTESCTVTTPSIPSATVLNCGTLAAINSPIYTTNVTNARNYRYVITLMGGENNDVPTIYTQSFTRPGNFVRLTELTTVPIRYNAVYKVEISAESLLNGEYTFSSPGTCYMTSPFEPTLQYTSCLGGGLAPDSMTAPLYVTPFAGSPRYRYILENELLGYSQQIDNTTLRFVRLSQFNTLATLIPGEAYRIRIFVELYGVYYEGKSCEVTIPGGPPPVVTKTVEPFKATAYPNPFANNFMLDVKTSSQSIVSLKVYDMIGRLIEQREATVSDLETTTIGDRYPSGVYNVVVSQEDSVQTVRVVKR